MTNHRTFSVSLNKGLLEWMDSISISLYSILFYFILFYFPSSCPTFTYPYIDNFILLYMDSTLLIILFKRKWIYLFMELKEEQDYLTSLKTNDYIDVTNNDNKEMKIRNENEQIPDFHFWYSIGYWLPDQILAEMNRWITTNPNLTIVTNAISLNEGQSGWSGEHTA